MDATESSEGVGVAEGSKMVEAMTGGLAAEGAGATAVRFGMIVPTPMESGRDR